MTFYVFWVVAHVFSNTGLHLLLSAGQQSIDVLCLPGPQQQTRNCGVRCANGKDKQTDGHRTVTLDLLCALCLGHLLVLFNRQPLCPAYFYFYANKWRRIVVTNSSAGNSVDRCKLLLLVIYSQNRSSTCVILVSRIIHKNFDYLVLENYKLVSKQANK